MDLSIYATGFGLDLSKEKNNSLQSNSLVHSYIRPNNLYSLRQIAKPESLDFIYSKDIINFSKFYRILLKEWFNFCKKGGYIIIEFSQNKIIGPIKLLNEIKMLFGKNAKVVEDFYDGDEGVIVIKKMENSLKKNDSIEKWSFGIITGGKREEWVEKEIESIKNLRIPHYEIIVCGGKPKKGIVHIPFGENDGIGLGKNRICEKAKYENLVITHDKFIFDSGWYEGMKKYGNYFDVLSCIILDKAGNRSGDWLTYGTRWDNVSRIGMLDYADWDVYGYIDGGLYIIKKSAWEKVKWNEKIFWGQAEDLALSREWYKNGIVQRFNPFSKVITLKWNHGRLREYSFNNRKLGSLKFGLFDLYSHLFRQRIKKILKSIHLIRN